MTVHHLAARGRRAYGDGLMLVAALVPPAIVIRLRDAARLRDEPLDDLVARLLKTVATGGPDGAPIIDAVLDDGECE